MRNLLALIICLYGINVFSQNCDNGRYRDSLFGVTVTSNLIYGHNTQYNGTAVDLKLDVYEPTGDTETQRPLIIFAPKGSFLQESKTELTMVQLCTHFASLGYVAAAIDYRVGVNYSAVMQNAQREFSYAVLRAYHDYKAAIRYFRKDAATTNTFKIDPDLIVAAGSSAGAITALHVAFLDEISEIPTVIDTAGLGGLEGTSGNPGYSSEVNYVVNLCGAIADSVWIKAGDQPIISMHGNLDTEVPYGTATISMVIPIMEMDGSASINLRAQHIDLENPFHTFWGRTHIPYDENAGGAYLQYMDTVKSFVTENLYPWICGSTSVKQTQANSDMVIYPNPASQILNLQLPEQFNNSVSNIALYDVMGKIILNSTIEGSKSSVQLKNVTSGIYYLKVETTTGVFTKKIILN